MESDTFRAWLVERGCSFEPRERGKSRRYEDDTITVKLGERRVEMPKLGPRQAIAPEVVERVVASLGLDPNELPGPKSRA
jgi:hypothetical protein